MDEGQKYEELSVWQSILDQIVNGRQEGHKCPFCKDGNIQVEADEFRIYVRCDLCGKWFEGMLA